MKTDEVLKRDKSKDLTGFCQKCKEIVMIYLKELLYNTMLW